MLPSLRSQAGDIVVAIDTSGSVGSDEMAQFIGEINALKGTLAVRTTLLACDSALAAGGPWIAEPWEPLALPRQFAGGGGTDFKPVFDWVERQAMRPDALVFFTDADGSFPPRPPEYPVLWLVKGRAPVPWGRRIALA
jgi:predicted metal-dependent peptidase